VREDAALAVATDALGGLRVSPPTAAAAAAHGPTCRRRLRRGGGGSGGCGDGHRSGGSGSRQAPRVVLATLDRTFDRRRQAHAADPCVWPRAVGVWPTASGRAERPLDRGKARRRRARHARPWHLRVPSCAWLPPVVVAVGAAVAEAGKVAVHGWSVCALCSDPVGMGGG